MLSIGSPDHLEIFTEVFLELAKDLLPPTVFLLLKKGLKQFVEQIVDASESRGRHGLGWMGDGVDDDSVALLEHEVDVLDGLKGRGLVRGWRCAGLQDAHGRLLLLD